MAPYKYSELKTAFDEIRLFKLLSGKFDELLKGLIFHTPSSNICQEEHYDAV
jgi:hypothetical protein